MLMGKLKRFQLLRQVLSDGYLFDKGFLISKLSGSPINHNGEPIPWLTYPLVDFLIPRLTNELSLLEYGAGNSTLFFSKYLKKITSIEHNYEWIQILKNKIPSNCEIITSADERNEYISHKEIKGDYDIILIDGLFRNDCAINAPKYLNSSGIIIFDDSNRIDYLKGFTFLKENNYKKLDFWGLSPGSIRNNCTSIFYLEENCLGI
jgi:hypothetical protein